MEKILDRISYSDFVAYLLPGSVSTSMLILISVEFGIIEVKSIAALLNSPANLLFFVLIGYTFGIIQSGSAYFFEKYNEDPNNVRQIINQMNSDALEDTAKKIFLSKFSEHGINENTWNSQYYFLMRSFVQYNSLVLFANSQRQNALRQIRLYLLPTIFLCYIYATIVAHRLIDNYIFFSYDVLVMYQVILVVVFYFVMKNLSKRSRFNRAREKRETLCSFVVLCTSNLSDKCNSSLPDNQDSTEDISE
ncbi:hypothetical protein [Candidatus Electronema sp. JC]|uniref:hypothetical protein n=1 Tax=Candidatus Electronema sp. JC TaxID=3401570 RepID=UPI003B4354A4